MSALLSESSGPSVAAVALSHNAALWDALSDPIVLVDAAARVQFANRAALRQVASGTGVDGEGPEAHAALLDSLLDAATRGWVLATLAGHPGSMPEGRTAPRLIPVESRRWAVVLPALHEAGGARQAMALLPAPDAVLRELHTMLWGSPFPACLQDEAFRLIDCNDAYAELVGRPRESLVGHDPMELQPAEDHVATQADRLRLTRSAEDPDVPALVEQRLIGRNGQLRWVRAARYLALTQDGRRLVLSLMHETTAEHAARELAERSSRELGQWFDLSPFGMALFDDTGLVLRSNVAFESVVGGALIELREASAEVRSLLGWRAAGGNSGLDAALEPGGAWVSAEGNVTMPDGSQRWVRSLLRCYEVRNGQRRYMCMLEDRTAEEERDLARQQLGALVDTAGIGVASFGGGEAGGGAGAGAGAPGAGLGGSGLQAIRRELVTPASLPEFERLQRALKQAERCEARYAIQHPELGLRWLLTRVEPGRLASGRPTTSVVTLDITEQHKAQERAEQVLTHLSSILESSPAGIASLRGYSLMHCNRRFERMLRLPAGAGVGSDIRALLASRARGLPDGQALADALDQGSMYETEIEVRGDEGEAHWYALSVRRTGPAGDAPQSIAVLSEITRLKLQQNELAALASERARMAHVLGQQADRTRAVLDSVLVGIVTVDERGHVSWLNRSARRMFGGDLGDFLGQPVDAVAADDDYHPFARSAEMLADLRDGEAVKFECRVKARDGRTFWVVGNAVGTLGMDGSRELTFALMDIEQRRQAEGRVAEARASLQRIIEAAPMAITVWDAVTLEAQQMNRAALALSEGLTGAAMDAHAGRVPEELYPPELAATVRSDMRQALATAEGVATPREYRVRARGGEQVWDVQFLPLRQADGRAAQLLMVASNVTDQRAAQRAELQAAIAQREMLVQEVHHRIKNNLQGVAGLMQQIALRRPEVQPVMAEVVGQVQAIAQVYGLQVGTGGPLNACNVAEAIAQSVQRTFGRTITFAAAGEQSAQWALPENESIPIALTLNELLTNAVKHSPAASPVHVHLMADAAGITVQIANQGGLPPGFRIEHRPQAVSGLGLVRALLPRRHASLAMEQRGDLVVATVSLAPPVVVPSEAPAGVPSRELRDVAQAQ